MKVFVINLERSPERRLFMRKQFDVLGLSYCFFNAVDGRLLSGEEVNLSCNQRWLKRLAGRAVNKNEIACALSHVYLLRKIVNENIPYALVLEDDAILDPRLPKVLAHFDSFLEAESNSVYLLCDTWAVRRKLVRFVDEFTCAPVLSSAFTHAYVVTNFAAKQLLSVLYPVKNLADCWKWLIDHRVVDVFAVRPSTATQDQCNFESMIWLDGESDLAHGFLKMLRSVYARAMRDHFWSQLPLRLIR